MKNIESIEFRDALFAINEEILTLDNITSLIAICPKDDEIKIIKAYQGLSIYLK